MSQLARPDIGKLNSRLAANNARVTKFLDSLPGRVDQLVVAALNEDWTEVRRLSEYLARSGETYGYPRVGMCADQVCREMEQPENQLGIKRSLVRLIGACGSAESPTRN